MGIQSREDGLLQYIYKHGASSTETVKTHHRARRDAALEAKKEKCEALEISSVVAEFTGAVASEAAGLAEGMSIFGAPAAAVAAGAATAAYATKMGVDIAHIKEGCDDIPFDEIKEVMDKRFGSLDKAVDRNYEEILKVSKLVTKTLDTVELTRIEMNQGFNRIVDTIRSSDIGEILSKLNIFIQYFDNGKSLINHLSKGNYISRIGETNIFLNNLHKSRTPDESSLFSTVNHIINQDYAVPKDANDKIAISALYSLHYAIQTYVAVLLFLVEQHSKLADYHYRKGDLVNYNKNFNMVKIVFDDFKNTLASKGGLIDKIAKIMDRVQEKDFITDEREVTESITAKLESLDQIKSDILQFSLPVLTDEVDRLSGNPAFTSSAVSTPIGDWKDGRSVSYALQYRNGDRYSKIGEWSEPFDVYGQACPVLNLPIGPLGKTKLIFRKFDNDDAELVGIVEDENQTQFWDINRDLYNAAGLMNQQVSTNTFNTLLQKGADINAVFDQKRHVLHSAANGGNVAVTNIILNKATSLLNAADENGYSPLHLAAETGRDNVITILSGQGADINAKTKFDKETPLHIAARKGLQSTVTTLMNTGRVNINAGDKDGLTALHNAVRRGLPIVTAILKDRNVDVNAKSATGLTPLHLAAIDNYSQIAEELSKNNKLHINSQAALRLTPLHYAAIMGNMEMVQFLIRKGAYVNAGTEKKFTPLHYAVALKKKNIVLELLKNDKINVNAKTRENVSPLHMAFGSGQYDIITELIKRGASIEEKTEAGLTPLHVASMHTNKQVVDFLIRNRAKLEARTSEGLTPLLTAAVAGNLEIVKFLLNKGANINNADFNRRNVLHYAAQHGRLLVLKYLVEDKKLPVEGSTTYQENTPLLSSIAAGNLDVVKYLVQKGANVAAKNRDDKTVLHLAAENRQYDILKYFVEQKNLDVKTKGLLESAIKGGSVNILKYLVEQKSVPVSCNSHVNCSILKNAASLGYLNILKYLQDKTRVERSNPTLLQIAALNGHLNILKYLIEEKDTDVEALKEEYRRGTSYLSETAKNGRLNIIRYLFERDLVNIDELQGTILENAVYGGSMSLVKYLLEGIAIAEVDAPVDQNTKYTPLHVAAMGITEQGASDKSNSYMIRYLVDHMKANVNSRDKDGNTPLHIAATYNSVYGMKFLLLRGASLDTLNNKNQNAWGIAEEWSNTPGKSFIKVQELCNAILDGNAGVVPNIYETCIDIKRSTFEVFDTTPLHLAAERGLTPIAKMILNKQSNIDIVDSNGNTALHLAAKGGYQQLVDLLLENNADANIENNDYQKPIDMVPNGAQDVAEKLSQHTRNRRSINQDVSAIGINCNSKDNIGKTPCLPGATGENKNTAEFNNPLCIQNNVSVALLLLQNFLDKKYPLPNFSEITPEKAQLMGIEISEEIMRILERSVKLTDDEMDSLDFYQLYMDIADSIQKENFSNLTKVLQDFLSKGCPNAENISKLVADKVGKLLLKFKIN